jgi:enoyl-CoA hydratase/carnithine racemase
LTRSKSGVLEIVLHTNDDTPVFNGHVHEQFVELFHAVRSDPDNCVVILTGCGSAFMERLALKDSTSSLRGATTRSPAKAGRC